MTEDDRNGLQEGIVDQVRDPALAAGRIAAVGGRWSGRNELMSSVRVVLNDPPGPPYVWVVAIGVLGSTHPSHASGRSGSPSMMRSNPELAPRIRNVLNH